MLGKTVAKRTAASALSHLLSINRKLFNLFKAVFKLLFFSSYGIVNYYV